MPSSRILPYNPTAILANAIETRDKYLPSGIKQNAPATIFLPTMPKPRRGILKYHDDNEWYFHFGRTNTTDPIHLKHLHRDGLELIQNGHLIKGHPTFASICLHNPCLFHGKPDGKNTLYLGLYVNDICYFSASPECKKYFEKQLGQLITVDFMGDATHYLGLKFDWVRHENGELDCYLSQRTFAEQTVSSNGLSAANPTKSPYRSSHPVDSVAPSKLSPEERLRLSSKLCSMVGSILWLSQGTRPDLCTIVSMLAQYQANPSYGHIRAAKHVIRYIKGTPSLGIKFSSTENSTLQAFMNFPLPHNRLLPFTDANWGGQDQGHNQTSITELERFKTRSSMSGYVIFFNGPLHWSSCRQKITARSSAEAEIYATDECIKELLRIRHMCTDLDLLDTFMPDRPINVYNDNQACVCWSKSTTTKGLRHITIRENAIRESVDDKFIWVLHVDGKLNLADLFTKEMKDTSHFITLRDHLVSSPPISKNIESILVPPLSLPRIEGGIRTDGQIVST